MSTSSSAATATATAAATASDIIKLLFVHEPLLVSSGTTTSTNTGTNTDTNTDTATSVSYYYNYGTAGFRFKATVMDGLMVRVGILSIMLLLQQQQQQPILQNQIMDYSLLINPAS
mmetsp:Transcript_5379/g.6059  ORF Transcript_5379/g.6059 Transcript_5379/m.6059 type:complete len:116 (+) Transcript_5379:201-548(+)